MAFSIALAKAKGASQYKPSTDFEESDSKSSFELDATENSRADLLQNIFELKQQTDDLRIEIEKQRLNQYWENQLASPEILQKLEILESQLKSVLNSKDACLSILRNSVSKSSELENSLSLKRDRQADLVKTFDTLAKILESKQEHLSNTNWVINQNWEKFGQDLESVQTKILKAQAVLSNDLENIQAIGNFTDTTTNNPNKTSFGNFIPQDSSSGNLILPVIPRINPNQVQQQ